VVSEKQSTAEKWQAQAARFALLSEVVLLISELSDLDPLIKKTIGKLKWVIDFERCTLSLPDDDGEGYETKVLFEARRGVSKKAMTRMLSEGVAGQVLRTGRMRLIAPGSPDTEPVPSGGDPDMEGDMPTVLVVPVRAYDRNLGALCFGTRRGRGFSREDIKVAVSFATHLALAVDRCRTTQKLKEARDRAEQATRTKSQFLANMSHELRTPLNAVIGITEMLLEDAEEEQSEEMVEPLSRIFNAGKHLLSLINNVLDLSKIEAGAVELHNERFLVSELLKDIECTVAVLAQKNGNTLIVEGPDVALEMCADITRCKQIVLNLLSNACKFTQAGTVSLAVHVEQSDARDWLVWDVSDTGIGLSPKQIGGLFREFTQADASTTRKYGGTGLGLAISKRLAEAMGGGISVESELGVGTTFTVRLPIAAKRCPKATAKEPSERAEGPSSNTILVIDDEATTREVMQRFLSREGFDVIAVASGQEGLERARELRPAVITLDVMMPGLNGWEVLQQLKADPELAGIPVVMLTILDEKKKGLSLGAAEYATKPIDRGALRRILARYRGHDRSGGVLVVEDDVATRELLHDTLRSDGWSVRTADNGVAALAALEQDIPALLILDLMMPEMNGFEVLEHLRAHEAYRSIPVVVITAMDLGRDELRALSGGVETIVNKCGRSTDDLLGELRTILGRHTGHLPAGVSRA
jgi:adenylate cyclase